MSGGPLSGIRVADFTWIGAGAYTTKLLADFGAEVIRIETSTHLDTLRMTPPFKDGVPGINRSGYFADRNTSKKSVALNAKTPAGLDIAHRLIARCDVVANNFRPKVMDRLGLGYADVVKLRPDIVYLSMSMQGSEGPHAHYVGFGLTIGALTGLQHLSGPPDRPPAGTNTNYPDHVPNPCHAAFAVLTALMHRYRTGVGQYIDFAQTEPIIALLGPAILDYTANGRNAERCSNDHPLFVPHGVYPCAGDDRWIAIVARNNAEWHGIISVLGGDGAEHWAHWAERCAGRNSVDVWIAERTRHWDRYELMHRLQERGVAAGVVQTAEDLVDADPQLQHRGHWVRLDHPEMGRSLYNNVPFRLSRTPGALHSPAPMFGEHTEIVCRDMLGMSADEFAALKREGVFE